jgi:hypothetical protein
MVCKKVTYWYVISSVCRRKIRTLQQFQRTKATISTMMQSHRR